MRGCVLTAIPKPILVHEKRFVSENSLDQKTDQMGSIPSKTHLFHGVPHGFRRFGDKLSASKKWDAAIDEGILWCLSGPKATGKFDVIVEGENFGTKTR